MHTPEKLLIGLLIIFSLFGCGIHAKNKNIEALKNIEKGTKKETLINQLSNPLNNSNCKQVGIIDGGIIESCEYMLNFSDLWANNIFFHKDKYIGNGRINNFLNQYAEVINATQSNSNKSLILLNRVTSKQKGFLRLVNVYDNGSFIGELAHEGSVIWDHESNKEIILEITQSKKTAAKANFILQPNKVYNLSFDYSTGVLKMDGDETSVIKITSTPPGAIIFAGSSYNKLKNTGFKTPYIFYRSAQSSRWAPEYYSVKLNGYEDSQIIFKNNAFGNRKIDFDLSPIKISQTQPKPKEPKKPIEEYDIYTGTGWVTQSGYIITNYHVIENQVETFIRFNSLQTNKFKSNIILSDAHNDLAILKINDPSKPPVPGLPITLKLPKLGASVFTIGYPKSSIMGLNPKITNGIVSSLSGLHDDPRIIQTTVAIQSGNSGGPLLDMEGKVVGVTTSTLRIFSTNDGIDIPQNVNYAVKSAYVLALLSSLPEVDNYPMVALTKFNLEDIVPKVQDSIVQVIVKTKKND